MALSFLQGVSILMLVPLLGFAGLLDDSGPTEGIGVQIAEIFQIQG